MKKGFRVIDTWRHVTEPRDLWQRWIDPAFRNEAPRWADGASPVLEVAGKAMTSDPAVLAGLAPQPGCEGAASAKGHLADMDREGVDVAVLFPTAATFALYGDHVPLPLAGAIARGYNDWLADYCAADPARLRGIALLPLQDPAAAAGELARAVDSLGFVGGVVRSNPLRQRQLFSADYFPLYAMAERLGVPLCIETGPGSILPEIGVKDVGLEWPDGVQRFEGLFARTAISYPMETIGALISLSGEEPMMEFPGLKAFFGGSGAGWLHWWVERMDDEFFHLGYDAITTLKPGDYVERQAAVAAFANEPILPYLIEEFGGNLTWGSGYPGPFLAGFPDELDPLTDNPELSEETKRAILWDNPAKFFNIT